MGFRNFIMRLCYTEAGRDHGRFMYESYGSGPVPAEPKSPGNSDLGSEYPLTPSIGPGSFGPVVGRALEGVVRP